MDNKHFTLQLAAIDSMARRETIKCVCIVIVALIIAVTVISTAFLVIPQTRSANTYISTTVDANGTTTTTTKSGRSTTTVVTDSEGRIIATCISSGRISE